MSTITDPMTFALECGNSITTPPALIYSGALVWSLYSSGTLPSREDRELMQVLLRICDAKDKRREVIKAALFSIPMIQRLFQKNGDEGSAREHFANIKNSGYGVNDNKDNYHILETIITLEKLGSKDLDLLRCLFAIAKGTAEEKLFVLRFLRDGGFIDESSSFVQNNRETKLQSISDLAFMRMEQD